MLLETNSTHCHQFYAETIFLNDITNFKINITRIIRINILDIRELHFHYPKINISSDESHFDIFFRSRTYK